MATRLTGKGTPDTPVYARRALGDKTSDDARLLPTPLLRKGGRNWHRDVVDIWQWIKKARVGDVCCYHRGFLTADCSNTFLGNFERKRNQSARAEAQRLARRGMAFLLQERISENVYAYLAVRTESKKSLTWWR